MVNGTLEIDNNIFYPYSYGPDCNLPSPIDCYFNQIIGILAFIVMIGIVYLLMYHLKEKLTLR